MGLCQFVCALFLPQLLRKYIAYARQYVHPRLTGAPGLVVRNTASGAAWGCNSA